MAALRELLADFQVRVRGSQALQRADAALNRFAANARRADGRLRDLIGPARDAQGRFTRLHPVLGLASRGLRGFGRAAAGVAGQLTGRGGGGFGGGAAAGGLLGATDSFNKLLQVTAGAGAAFGIGRLSDEYTTLQNRLRVLTDSQEEAARVEDRLFQISNRTFNSIGSTTEVYQRFGIATRRLNLDQDRLLNFTERVQQSFALTGGSAQAVQGALVQFSQALGQNFQAVGEEINSIVEQAPFLAKILEDELGRGTGKTLKQLAKDGVLTSEAVIKAVENAGTELDRQFLKRAPKFSDSVTVMGNALVRFTGRIGNASGASTTFGGIADKVLKVMGEWEPTLVELAKRSDLLRLALVGLLVVLAPLVASALAAAAPFVALVLALEDLWVTLEGGDSVTRDFLNKWFGSDSVESGLKDLKGIVDGVTGGFKELFNFLTGQSDTDTFVGKFLKETEKLGQVGDKALGGLQKFFGVDEKSRAENAERIAKRDLANDGTALGAFEQAVLTRSGEGFFGTLGEITRKALGGDQLDRERLAARQQAFVQGEGDPVPAALLRQYGVTPNGSLEDRGGYFDSFFGDIEGGIASEVRGNRTNNIVINMNGQPSPAEVGREVGKALDQSDRRAVMSRAP